MKPITLLEITKYVEENIQYFHQRRLESLQNLKLMDVIKRKNPYLFKAKAINTAQDFVKHILDARLSSQEETIFGGFLEGLAVFICSHVYSGQKSSAEGIDLEFERENIRYIVSIKSGPNWGNSSQISKLKDNFSKAKRILRTNKSSVNVVAINGCCYGKNQEPDKGDNLKYCGQMFWEFISGNPNLYTEIIEPLGHQARTRNEQFKEEYETVLNRFSYEFMTDFCNKDGKILWEELIKFNSSNTQS
ncbi:cytosolic protein [Candidatus Poribacteria bacterium]|nr:cytosolic protein [Candidatus Poribacteria bacterium]